MDVNKDLALEIFTAVWCFGDREKKSVISCIFTVHSYHETLGNHSKSLWKTIWYKLFRYEMQTASSPNGLSQNLI